MAKGFAWFSAFARGRIAGDVEGCQQEHTLVVWCGALLPLRSLVHSMCAFLPDVSPDVTTSCAVFHQMFFLFLEITPFDILKIEQRLVETV